MYIVKKFGVNFYTEIILVQYKVMLHTVDEKRRGRAGNI
jgi:hypothetical protein